MKIGLILSLVPPRLAGDVARRAEALGYDSLWLGEHIVLPLEESDSHPYGKPGLVQPRSPNLEPFVQLAHLAGLTQRIRLATGVLILPIRNVFSTAREIATLDIVSNGRLDLGVGVGWHGGEFALMGADFASRGAHTDEFLDALDQLLREPSPSFQGRHIAFEPVGFEPKPVQTPRVPIFVGGDSRPAMRRAALRGDGWYGHANSPGEGRARIEAINRLLTENGRDPEGFERIVQVWEPPDRKALRAYQAAGADRIVTCPFRPKDPDFDPIRAIEDYARSIDLAPPA